MLNKSARKRPDQLKEPPNLNNYKVEETTSFVSVLSNNTTLPPRSPVARWSPVLSNSIAEMTSTAITETENKS